MVRLVRLVIDVCAQCRRPLGPDDDYDIAQRWTNIGDGYEIIYLHRGGCPQPDPVTGKRSPPDPPSGRTVRVASR